jgi:aconitate hydratase
LGVVNAFTDGEAGLGIDARDGSVKPLPDLAREYKRAGIEWIAVGDDNYGEGSSREHAAMEPRFMGGRAVLARSFARIAEANLKKQGVLPLTFADPADYDEVRADDLVDLDGLSELAPGTPVQVVLRHADGTRAEVVANHTLSEEHIAWFEAGSALNLLASRR